MLQTTFDLCLNSVRMCMDVRNTLERLCVQLNMADTNMSAGELSCDEKHEKRKRKGKWNVTALIDLLEERPCLWNIFDSQYTKREKRDSAYKEIAETLEREVGEIKTKINNLRAQLGREIGKVKKTKSGQATNELYQPLWINWERLQFLANQMQSGGTRDTIDINASAALNDEVSKAEDNIQPKAKLKRKNQNVSTKRRWKTGRVFHDVSIISVIEKCRHTTKTFNFCSLC